ncbi:MAG: ATP-dependent Clp protease ATP-binding subunit [Planctomycetales bacterium]|nr:ATP-dependent Clp protease ATP-binding subunit [Planctomycetales bacterium]
MLEQELSLPLLIQGFSEEMRLGEVLFFPEFSRLDQADAGLRSSLGRDVRQWLDELESDDRLELHRRLVRRDLAPIECRYRLAAPAEAQRRPESAPWHGELELCFYGVQWTEHDGSLVAYFPSLGIEVQGDSADSLAENCRVETLNALRRLRRTHSLRMVWGQQRVESLSVELAPMRVAWHSLRQTVRLEEQGEDTEKSVLDEVATRIARTETAPAYCRDELVARIIELLTARRPASLLLLGPSGVGKTALVGEVVRQALSGSAAHRDSQGSPAMEARPVYKTDGTQLISGMLGFGMWQQRCQQLWRECSKRNAILHVGSLVELMEVGKCEGQSQGIASFLRPYIARGDLLVIAECTPEQLAVIERAAPQLLAAFQQLEVAEPDEATELQILQRVHEDLAQHRAQPLTDSALERLAALHRRYATYSASPGRPLRFLRNLVADRSSFDESLTAADVTEAFSKETGLPLAMLEEVASREPSDRGPAWEPAELFEWFASRVIGQQAAVGKVVDLLMKIKANLNRENRPLASLLFVGPTGVGKTELAKALARFLFGSPQRLIRIDMSEYADGLGVQRLIGDSLSSEGVLTAKVREQPFSIVLLDEFEKAHPLFFDLLLQVLGEGRLTDGAGRLADFRNSVVIMTSNLGTEDFAARRAGFDGSVSAESAEAHFIRAVEGFLRPELYNRMEEVIPFHALDDDTARQIVRRELELASQRDGIRLRPIDLEIADSVVEHLLRRGFEPAYGARSLKRVLEREVLVPLASKLTAFGTETPLRATVDVHANNVRVSVDSIQHVASEVRRRSTYRTLEAVQQLRRFWQRMQGSSTARELRDREFQLRRFVTRVEGRNSYSEAELRKMAEHGRLQRWLQQIDGAADELLKFEDAAMLMLCLGERAAEQALTGDAPEREEQAEDRLNRWQREMDELTLRLHAESLDSPDKMNLFLYGGAREALAQLCGGYASICAAAEIELTLYQFREGDSAGELTPERWTMEELAWHIDAVPRAEQPRFDQAWRLAEPKDEDHHRYLRRLRVRDVRDFLGDAVPAGTLGLLLELRGAMAFAKFMGEAGLHEFAERDGKSSVYVLEEQPPASKFLPPWRFQREAPGTKFVRRIYRPQAIEDPVLKRSLAKGRLNFAEVLGQLMDARHLRVAREVVTQ